MKKYEWSVDRGQSSKPIENRVWPIENKYFKHLPWDCKWAIMDIVKGDVELCVKNNGINDEICQEMANEESEMRYYLLE